MISSFLKTVLPILGFLLITINPVLSHDRRLDRSNQHRMPDVKAKSMAYGYMEPAGMVIGDVICAEGFGECIFQAPIVDLIVSVRSTREGRFHLSI